MGTLLVSRAAAQTCGSLTGVGVYAAAFTGSTVGQANSLSGSCGGGNGPEVAFTYVAPRTGTYVIDTLGSTLDTVLYVRTNPVLKPTEIVCSDDISPPATHSQVTLNLTGGAAYQIVVDSFGLGGDFTLRINPACPLAGTNDARDLGSSLSVYLNLTTACGPNLIGQAPCTSGGGSAPDAVFLYTAPATATYAMSTFSVDFDTILTVRDAGCDGTPLACNDDLAVGNRNSALSVPLVGGQQVAVIVDGFGASFGNSGSSSLQIDALGCCQFSGRCEDATSSVVCSDGGLFFQVAGQCVSDECVAPTTTSTNTSTPTATPTPTATVPPSATPTLTPTPTPTATMPPSATPTLTPTPTPLCTGDCDRSGSVSLTELVLCLRVVNGNRLLSECVPCDRDSDGPDLRDLVRALRNANDGGCR